MNFPSFNAIVPESESVVLGAANKETRNRKMKGFVSASKRVYDSLRASYNKTGSTKLIDILKLYLDLFRESVFENKNVSADTAAHFFNFIWKEKIIYAQIYTNPNYVFSYLKEHIQLLSRNIDEDFISGSEDIILEILKSKARSLQDKEAIRLIEEKGKELGIVDPVMKDENSNGYLFHSSLLGFASKVMERKHTEEQSYSRLRKCLYSYYIKLISRTESFNSKDALKDYKLKMALFKTGFIYKCLNDMGSIGNMLIGSLEAIGVSITNQSETVSDTEKVICEQRIHLLEKKYK